MSKPNHTPGPWVLQGEGVVLHPVAHCEIRTTRIETTLGNIEVWDQTNEPSENVRLMTAAPELLAAVKGLLHPCGCNPAPGEACPHVLAAEAAIAKAEGR
jgi:hypothetical protein